MANLKLNMDSLKQRKDWKRHQVNSGDNIYRVLPPFGDASNGYPYYRWVVAWMNDPETGRRKPYASPFSFGEKACPVQEYFVLLEKKRDEVAAQLKAEGANKEETKEALAPYGELVWKMKPKAGYVYNACNKAGEVGLLELKKTAHDGVKKVMMNYITDYSQDPTSLSSAPDDSGVWLKISREGEGKDTEYTVTKSQTKKKTADGLVFVDDREALPENVVENYNSLAYDLTTLYKRSSYDELRAVLMKNLEEVYATFPDAIMPGFELETAAAAKPVAKAAPAVKGTKPLAIKLDDDEDETPVVVKQAAKPVKKAAPADDDVFAYAESILNS